MRALVVVAAVALVVAVGWTLTRALPSTVGYNGVRPGAYVGRVAPRERVCQSLGSATHQADHALVTLGAGAGEPVPLQATVSSAPRAATVLRKYADGPVSIPIPPDASGRLCLRNLGRRPVLLAGEPFPSATVDGRRRPFAVAVTLVSSERESWGSEAGQVLRRVGLARAGSAGPATGWIAIGLLVLGFAVTLAGAWRWTR